MKNIAEAPGRLVLAIAVLACAVRPAHATSITVANYSFEQVSVAYGSYSANNIPGWNFTGFVSTYHPTTTEITGGAQDGLNVAAVGAGFSIFQTLSATLTADTNYSLQVAVGERTDIVSPGYLVSLYAGGNLLASESSHTLISGSFITSTVSYYASVVDPNLGQALTIRLSVGGISNQTEFDNVRLDATPAATPEPATFWAAGLFALLLPVLAAKQRHSRTELNP